MDGQILNRFLCFLLAGELIFSLDCLMCSLILLIFCCSIIVWYNSWCVFVGASIGFNELSTCSLI